MVDVDLFPFTLSDALTLVHKMFVSMFNSDFFPFSFCSYVRDENGTKRIGKKSNVSTKVLVVLWNKSGLEDFHFLEIKLEMVELFGDFT